MSRRTIGRCASFAALALAACVAPAQEVSVEQGIEFVAIRAAGNAPYDRQDPFNAVPGRGRVDVDYRIGRYEVTSAQWVEFFSAFNARATPIPLPQGVRVFTPVFWGGETDPTYTGPGRRFRVVPSFPNAGMLPAGGISWRTAAMFCNWLHNNKATNPEAFLTGAYNVATFSGSGFPTFTDQPSRSPGARFWIPSLDEWMKAVHYDPNRFGPGAGGWWEGPFGSDALPVYGPPLGFPNGSAANQANSGWFVPGGLQYTVTLGAYPNAVTPWGLFDAAGATREWTEGIRTQPGSLMGRISEGSSWGLATNSDEAFQYGVFSPEDTALGLGFRVATAIPSPSVLFCCIGPITLYALRRVRRHSQSAP